MYKIQFLALIGVLTFFNAYESRSADSPLSLQEKKWVNEVVVDPVRTARAQSLLLDSWAENKILPCWRFLELGFKQNWHECVEKKYGADASALIEWILPYAYGVLNRYTASYGSPFIPNLGPTLPKPSTPAQFLQNFWIKLNTIPNFQKQVDSFFKNGGGANLPAQEFLAFQTAPLMPSLSRNTIETIDTTNGASHAFFPHPHYFKIAHVNGTYWQYTKSFQAGNKGNDPKQYLGNSVFRYSRNSPNINEFSFREGGAAPDLIFVPIARNLALYAWVSKIDQPLFAGVAYLPSLSERIFPLCERAKELEKQTALTAEQMRTAAAAIELDWLTELSAAEVNALNFPQQFPEAATIQNLALQDHLLTRLQGATQNPAVELKLSQALGLPLLPSVSPICESFKNALQIERRASAKELEMLKDWKISGAPKIRILSATLAPNLNQVYEGNLTQSIRSQCDGYDRCSYAIPADGALSGAPGMGFQVRYLCEDAEALDSSQVTVQSISVSAPAERKIVDIRCVHAEKYQGTVKLKKNR